MFGFLRKQPVKVPEPPVPAAVASPCVKVCQLDPTFAFCIGCLRQREEIAGWFDLTDAQKQAVIDSLPRRRLAQATSAAE